MTDRHTDTSDAEQVERLAADEERLGGLGVRLKNLRRVRGLSLQAVAAAVGVSPSFLSLLERGHSDVSLGRFARLAEFYGIAPSELLLEGDDRQHRPEIARVRDATSVQRGPGVEYHVVRHDHPQVMHVRMEPFSGFSSLTAHAGEDFWIVMSGRPDLLLGGERYALHESNTIRFAGIVPHGWENQQAEPAELIAVATVPYW